MCPLEHCCRSFPSTQLMATRSFTGYYIQSPTCMFFPILSPIQSRNVSTCYPVPIGGLSVIDPEADGYELKGLINEANFDWQSLSCLVTVNHICKQIGTKLLIADLYGHYGDDMVSIKIGSKILELIEWHPGKDLRHRDFGRDLMHFGPENK